tara:strand:- start:90 stop:494 length:405 start_codon:yes stop_codon:yes gene_type:complete
MEIVTMIRLFHPVFQKSRYRIHEIKTLFYRVLALLTVGITSSPALAQLPTMDEPTRGEGSGLMETIQNYLYDAAILGGLIIATVAFYIVGQSALAKYKEASEKGQWGAFGITIVVGIILIVAVIWLATKAAEIL